MPMTPRPDCAEAAQVLLRLVEEIRSEDKGTVTDPRAVLYRLEGAALALRAVNTGGTVTANDLVDLIASIGVPGSRPDGAQPTADTLRAVVEDAAGQDLDTLNAALALDVAEQLRAIVAALPPESPRDGRLAAQLIEAADFVERRAGAL